VGIDDGSVEGNSAGSGGGFSVLSLDDTHPGVFNFSGGQIINNAATGNGGGVNVQSGGQFTMTNGSILKNTAVLGQGVYVSDKTSIFTVTPTTPVSFEIADTIYLSDGTLIYVGADISSITGHLIVQLAHPASGVLVAAGVGGYNLTDPDDVDKFLDAQGVYYFYLDNNEIFTM
jgi:hypothetical protein